MPAPDRRKGRPPKGATQPKNKTEDNGEFKPYKSDNMGNHYKHPTFGVISISRTSGGGRPLFGSSIMHHESIRLVLSHAELSRDLSKDWISESKQIIEVEMSPTQFADAITSLNVGGGNPVTIRYISPQKGENLSRVDPPFQSKTAQFNQEFTSEIKDLSERFESVLQLAKDTKAQKRLQSELDTLYRFFKSNLPFINKQFTKQMEHTVKEAKGEVEAFVTHTVQSYGLDAIRKQAPQLPEAESLKLEEGKDKD